MSKGLWAVVVAMLVAAGGTWLWWRSKPAPPPEDTPVAAQPQAPSVAASAPAVAPEASIKHPLEGPEQALSADEVGNALVDLLGRKAVASFLQIDDFPRRFVATVDNLGRAHAPPAVWPVNPTADRFTVEEPDSGPVIGADNAARYTPFVLLVETVNIGRAVDLYVRMYPLLQRSYQELGYPNRFFNDRLVEVIDLLLATPDVEHPVKLQLMQVKGPIPSVRPWVRYEFADPALESLSAGQKVMVRVGTVNQRRLKGKLAEIREELVKRATKR